MYVLKYLMKKLSKGQNLIISQYVKFKLTFHTNFRANFIYFLYIFVNNNNNNNNNNNDDDDYIYIYIYIYILQQ